MNIKYKIINFSDINHIDKIAEWYFTEWNIPKVNTIKSLSEKIPNHVIFQTLMTADNTAIGSGGLYYKVGIQNRIQKFKNYVPWIALMYTEPAVRGQGYGEKLLKTIELEAIRKGFTKVYLFTHTAESLYKRNGWSQIDRYQIDGKNIVIMKKEI